MEATNERLINYFSIVGLKQFSLADGGDPKSGPFNGEILDVFPPRSDNPPFVEEIPRFCQPNGWRVRKDPSEPSFFGFVLTDTLGKKMYAACLTFHEQQIFKDFEMALSSSSDSPLISSNPRIEDTQQVGDNGIVYVPKSLVILSYHPYFTVFRSCLCALFNIFSLGSPVNFNRWVTFLTTEIPLPSSQVGVKFNLGDTKITITRPSKLSLPIFDLPLERFFRTLSIDLVLQLLACVLNERRILFISDHYSQLLLAAESLSTLLYPFMIQCVYIPILPSLLLEYLAAPTPFIMGLQRSILSDLDNEDLSEIVIVDLDGAKITCSGPLPTLPNEEASLLHDSLLELLHPDLVFPDFAFFRQVPLELQDKSKLEFQIRACFLRFFVSLFQEYRDDITVIKLFPDPIVFFQKNIFTAQKHPSKKNFLDQFLPTSTFDNFIREDGASLEKSLFSILVEEFKQDGRISSQLDSPPETFEIIKNPLERGEITAETKPLAGPLEFATFGEISMPSPSFTTNLPEPALPSSLQIAFSEDPGFVLSKGDSEAEIKVLKDFVLDTVQAKKSSLQASELDRIFQNPRNRFFFARELNTKCLVKGATEQQLDDTQFELVCSAIKKVLIESRKSFDPRTARFFVPLLGSFYRSPKIIIETNYYLYDYLRENLEETDILGDISFWEEAFFESVRSQRRAIFKGLISDAIKTWEGLSLEEKKEKEKNEDTIIFYELKNYILMMARLGFPLSETQKFLEGMSLGTSLNDTLNDKLLEFAEEWTNKEEDRIQSKRDSDDGAKKKVMQGNFIEQATLPDFILLPGEQILHGIEKVMYVSPMSDVAEGKLFISNFQICFFGSYLSRIETSLESFKGEEEPLKNEVKLKIPFGSIFEINKTNYMVIKKDSNSIWVPEGLEILAGDFQIATFCVDEESDMGPKEVMNVIMRLAFPATKDKMFAFSFNPSELDKSGENYFPSCKREYFLDDYNEKIDAIALGICEDLKLCSNWRVFTGNEKYVTCPTYPKRFVVPEAFSDEDVNTLAKFHKKKRLPVVCWRHPVNKSLLLRGAPPKTPRGNLNPRCQIDELFCRELAQMSPHTKFSILTEKEHSMNDLLYKTSQKNLGFYYASVEMVYVDSNVTWNALQARFSKFITSCANGQENDHFWSNAEENWLAGISDILENTGRVIQLIESNVCVLVALEDGSDRTTQIVSLAQLLMDPWYRTIQGFKCLIEKEWLRFGHKFGQRLGQSKLDNRHSENAPVFLQFMDCVFQLLQQFPSEFEFNDRFLRDILHEVFAARFGNFLFCSESERQNHSVSTKTHSLWAYLRKKHQKKPDFYNFQFFQVTPRRRDEFLLEPKLLIPSYSLSSLKLWHNFYLFYYAQETVSGDVAFNDHCKDLLTQLENIMPRPSNASGGWRESISDNGETKKEIRSVWHDNWIQIVTAREEIRSASKETALRAARQGSVASGIPRFPSSSEEIRLESYLIKQGGLVRSWKQRWFVLKAKEKKCYYYTDNSKTEEKGIIDLATATGVRASQNSDSTQPQFEIVTPGRIFYIRAANADSRTTWIEALRRVIAEKAV